MDAVSGGEHRRPDRDGAEAPAPSEGPEAAITGRLALAIHERRLAPGTKLSEDEIAHLYGVSRTVVRAALLRLSHDRLVVRRRNRGAFVAQPSIREAREVFGARVLLEPRTARWAAERAGPGDVTRLRDHMEAEHAAMAAGDPGRALRLSGLFHVEVARVADQSIIADFVAQLVARSSLVIALYWRSRSALCDSAAHHRLIEALATGDGDRAEAEMRGHLDDLLASLDLDDRPSAPQTLREALEP